MPLVCLIHFEAVPNWPHETCPRCREFDTQQLVAMTSLSEIELATLKLVEFLKGKENGTRTANMS